MDDLQAMVLAAGLGTRLWPLTLDRAKAAIPFFGRPLINRAIDLVARHGVSKVVVNTHSQPESVRDGVKSRSDVDLCFSHEAEILGTAGSLAKALADGKLDPARPTLIVNGKLDTDLDLTQLVNAHLSSAAEVTMALLPNRKRERFREVFVDHRSRVTGFGQGREPESTDPLLFTGIHVVSPAVLTKIPLTFSDTVRDIYPPLIEARDVLGHVCREQTRWWELSTLERYIDLHLEGAGRGLGPEISLSEGARIEKGARVQRSVLWEGASAGPSTELERVVLGSEVALGGAMELRDAVVVRGDLTEETRHGRRSGGLLIVPLRPGGNAP